MAARPSYEGGAAFGAPIIDDVLAFRASVSFRRDGGWVDRVGYTLVPNDYGPLPTPVYDGSPLWRMRTFRKRRLRGSP